MADQTLAQNGALRLSEAPGATPVKIFLRRLKRGCKLIHCLIGYALAGTPRSIPGLVDFVVADHFFSAIQVRAELTALGETLAALRPERALEIGTARGGTLFFLTRLATPTATIISVDLPGGDFGGGYGRVRRWCYQQFARSGQRLHFVREDSHSLETLRRVEAILGGEPLDYLFIDGDHTYEGVKKDFELYSPLVRRGGIIALHDIVEHPPETGCEVAEFWREIKRQYRYKEIIENREQNWAGIGVLYVE